MERMSHKSFMNCFRVGKQLYGVLMLALQLYTNYDLIETYLEFKSQLNDPRYGYEWSETPMNVALVTGIFSLSLLHWFVYSCLIKTGNLMNDGIQLGAPQMWNLLPGNSYFLRWVTHENFRPKFYQKLRYYLNPSAQSLHFVSAFIMFFPHIFMETERFKKSALNEGYLWTSDLHSLFNRVPHSYPLIILSPFDRLRFPIATLNFLMASVFLGLRCCSVFYRLSRPLAGLLGLFDCGIALSLLLLQSSLRVCCRLQMSLLYQLPQTSLLLLAALILFLAARALFFQMACEHFRAHHRSLQDYIKQVKLPVQISSGSRLLQNSNEFRDRVRGHQRGFLLPGLLLCLWLTAAGCLIPLGCHLVQAFWQTQHRFLLLGLMAAIAALLLWLTLWLLVSVKKTWIFRAATMSGAADSYDQQIQEQQQQPDLLVPEPIYTCFQENRALSRCSNLSDKMSLFQARQQYNQSVASIPTFHSLDMVTLMRQQHQQQNQQQQQHLSLIDDSDYVSGGYLKSAPSARRAAAEHHTLGQLSNTYGLGRPDDANTDISTDFSGSSDHNTNSSSGAAAMPPGLPDPLSLHHYGDSIYMPHYAVHNHTGHKQQPLQQSSNIFLHQTGV